LLIAICFVVLISILQLFEFQLGCHTFRRRLLPLREIVVRWRLADIGVSASITVVIVVVVVLPIIRVIPFSVRRRILTFVSLRTLHIAFLFLLLFEAEGLHVNDLIAMVNNTPTQLF
jgi:hypothetical protein